MDELDKALSENFWVVGDNFTLADIAIAPFIERFEANKLNMLIDFQKWSNIGRWWLELQSRSSYKIAYFMKNLRVSKYYACWYICSFSFGK